MVYAVEKINTSNYKHNYLKIDLTENSNLIKVFELLDVFINKESFNRKDSGTLIAAIKSEYIKTFEEIVKIVKENYKDLKAWIVGSFCYISFKDKFN